MTLTATSNLLEAWRSLIGVPALGEGAKVEPNWVKVEKGYSATEELQSSSVRTLQSFVQKQHYRIELRL